jgi:hypothetical protein
MSDHSHADHKPPHRTPGSFGVFYPENDIIAVIDDRAEAERAVEALQAAGIPAGDIDLATGEQVLEYDREFRRQQQNPVGRLARAVSHLFSEDARYEDEFAEAARAGRQFLVVHAPRAEVAERLRPILATHHARLARHYRRGIVVDLVHPRAD